MATRKEHLEKASELLTKADSLEWGGSLDSARRKREAAEGHIRLAEAMRPTRPTFGTTRIPRGRS